MIAADRGAAMSLLLRFGKASNVADVDGVLACVTPDFAWRLAKGLEAPDARIVRGNDAVREALAERAAVIRRIKFSETEVTIAGDRIVGGLSGVVGSLPGEAISQISASQCAATGAAVPLR